jgi:hypothetical protein
MCGRARLSSDVSEIKIAFGIPPERPTPNVAPSWNVAPTDPLPIVHYDAKAGTRDLEVMRWGLIPYWAKDIKIGFSTINARAEEVDTSRLSRRKRPVCPGNTINRNDYRVMLLDIFWTIKFFPLARPPESPGLPRRGFPFAEGGARRSAV